MEKELRKLDTLLKEKRPANYAQLNEPLTDEEIIALETAYQVRLPLDLKALYRWKNGQNLDVFSVLVNGSYFEPLEKVLSTTKEFTAKIGDEFYLVNQWSNNWLPIFCDGGGSRICYDLEGIFTGQQNQLVLYLNGYTERQVIAPSLQEFIGQVVQYYEDTPTTDYNPYFDISDRISQWNQVFSLDEVWEGDEEDFVENTVIVPMEDVEGLAENFDTLGDIEAVAVMKHTFSKYHRDSMNVMEGYQFFDVYEQAADLVLQQDDWRRKLLYKAIVHTNETVKATGLQALYRLVLTPEDLRFIEGLLGIEDAKLRGLLLEIICKEDDKVVLNTVEILLNSDILGQRLTGLELMAILKQQKRAVETVMTRINSYFERQKLVEIDEIVMVDGVLGSCDDETAPYLEMDEKDRKKIISLFSRKGIEVFQSSLLSLLAQSDDGARHMLLALLRSDDARQRLAGLHAIGHLLNQDRPEELVKDALTEYRKRTYMTMQEKVHLTKYD